MDTERLPLSPEHSGTGTDTHWRTMYSAERRKARVLAATTAAAVMPIDGINGSDPSPTLEQFQQYVAQGWIHWFSAGSGGGPGGAWVAPGVTPVRRSPLGSSRTSRP
jgi:hypothetical protein